MARAVQMKDEAPDPDSGQTGDLPHPREASRVIGHSAAQDAFAAAAASGALHHAWLIGGPRGIGKATLAYAMARHVLARSPAGDGPLPTDEQTGHLVATGAHPDLLVLRRAWDAKTSKFKTAIAVDDVRRVQGFLGQHANFGGWRVVIVDCADDLNASAANALLKSLEEPPSRALFLLVAHAPGRLLPTIRSRCRRLTLGTLSDEDVAALLAEHGAELAPADRTAIARLAGGSPGRALSLAAAGGLDLYRALVGVLGRFPNAGPDALMAVADRFGARAAPEAFPLAVELLGHLMQRLVRAGASGEPLVPVDEGDDRVLAAMLKSAGVEAWLETWDKLSADLARRDALNLDRRHLMLTALMRLQATAAA